MAAPTTTPGETRRRRRGPLGWLLRVVRFAALLVVGYLVGCALLLAAYRFVQPPVTTVQVQRWVESWGAPGADVHYAPIEAEAMAPVVRHAAVASEDARFYTHGGFDWEELRQARDAAARRGRPMRGASTITQQTVKNLFLTTHRSYLRKGLEVPLTLLAELILPKERILTLYLNIAEMGPGVFGIEAGARHHYGVSAARLTRNQAARLVAILPAPRSRTPQSMGTTAARIERRG
ncbi:MAG: monofunctional biosynthetic peptidoglycan transglycosylase, partial [Rubricoccaceae bacterium]|nr:monofunctional biosynthetic peptidoglycan transglycosylase [Rubricoccaceae bacterium]